MKAPESGIASLSHPRFAAICPDAATMLQLQKFDVATYHKMMLYHFIDGEGSGEKNRHRREDATDEEPDDATHDPIGHWTQHNESGDGNR
jgi:hypothetical protein